MQLSTLGLGSYLGDANPEVDAAYTEAAAAFHAAGGNVFDTAANYRGGRSERALGSAFAHLNRADYFISTKAGYLPMGDGHTEESPRGWFQRVLAGPGILRPEEIVDNCHAMTPRYLAHQLEVSLDALGLACVDLFHLHNPEQQLPHLGPDRFYAAIQRAFEACEAFVQAGKIRHYGVATWNGFRVPPGRPDHLDLSRLLQAAEAAGGSDHHFNWIQLPLNLAMPEAFLASTQPFQGSLLTPLQAAQAAGLGVQCSASIMQGRILGQLPASLLETWGVATPAQAALQFTRSCPGVSTALCGMAKVEHVRENCAVLQRPCLEEAQLKALFGV